MRFNIKKRQKLFIVIVALGVALVPIIMTAYQLLTTSSNTVVFLESFHPTVARVIELYYLLLLGIGCVWVVFQIKEIFKLKNENTKIELLHLQSQVNPHFFFNMLNNLYGLIDVDSQKAKALILKLSELMRYSIYEGERTTVTLEEEIEYLKNYIELHRMRYHKEIDISFHIETDNNDYKITPLLYIILVENAFKHGVENLREDAFVHIHLKATTGKISLEVRNNFDPVELPKKPGIGIQNLKRRLDLAYANKHTMTFTKTNEIYTATLHLEL